MHLKCKLLGLVWSWLGHRFLTKIDLMKLSTTIVNYASTQLFIVYSLINNFPFIDILLAMYLLIWTNVFCFLSSALQRGSHNVHLCLPQVCSTVSNNSSSFIYMVRDRSCSIRLFLQTLEALKRICPKQALLIGMTHEFDHEKDNEFLMEWSERYIDSQLLYELYGVVYLSFSERFY